MMRERLSCVLWLILGGAALSALVVATLRRTSGLGEALVICAVIAVALYAMVRRQ
jgi:hypothetical protein